MTLKRPLDNDAADVLLDLKRNPKQPKHEPAGPALPDLQFNPLLHPVQAALATATQSTEQYIYSSFNNTSLSPGHKTVALANHLTTMHSLQMLLSCQVDHVLAACVLGAEPVDDAAYQMQMVALLKLEIKRSGAKVVASMLKLMVKFLDGLLFGTPIGIALGSVEATLNTLFAKLRAPVLANPDAVDGNNPVTPTVSRSSSPAPDSPRVLCAVPQSPSATPKEDHNPKNAVNSFTPTSAESKVIVNRVPKRTSSMINCLSSDAAVDPVANPSSKVDHQRPIQTPALEA